MEFMKLPFPEQFSHWFSLKTKVFSRFSIGVGSSILILSLIFLYCPSSLFQPMFQGFRTSNDLNREGSKNSSFLSSTGGRGNKSLEGSVSEGSKNATFLSSIGEEQRTHEGNFTEQKINESLISEGDGNSTSSSSINEGKKKCDIYNGKWVRDEKVPYYPVGSCPYIERSFNCRINGRRNDDYLKWRWQPDECDIPRLNATDFLERLRGKRITFVGDSLNRNMWESLVCILRHGVANKSRVHEILGRNSYRGHELYDFRYEDYNCSVQYVSAPFLVKETYTKHPKLRLDVMDLTTSKFREADVIVFNTGHWWNHEKTSKGENYYQEGPHVYQKLEVLEAFEKALSTWGKWVDDNIDTNRTQVIFRGYSVAHFKGGQWNSGGHCHKETKPTFNASNLAQYVKKMEIEESVLQQMKAPVTYMNISRLTDYRKDGHPSVYGKNYKTDQERAAAVQDCSHWCLPGVPDTWNELLYASLLKIGT
ncbi:protein trichome birefringence-like 2 isoform X2 [Papaver somniferum]|uniref:protein trichome birefringence-like 2 isoform X2 n=1 Tax=Papaver somniferum TaxID=3469 RepID=UPI000E6FD4B8|nr:protein trichome birefringence-like 2 isoform X2 [Papaver somniferum]